MKLFLCIMLFSMGLFIHSQALGQCACCSSVGCGDNAGTGTSLVGQGKLLVNGIWRYTSFQPLNVQTLHQGAAADTLFPVYSKSIQSTYTLSVTYGISSRLNASATLPYSTITNIYQGSPSDLQPVKLGTSSGISNLKVGLQYVIIPARDAMGWEFLGSIGIILPTGVHTNVALNGQLFDDPFQPGADSWAPVISITTDKSFGKASLHASATYVFAYTDNSGNTDAALGNADITGYYRLLRAGHYAMKMANDSGKGKKAIPAMTMPKLIVNVFGAVQAEHVGQDIYAMSDGTRDVYPNSGVFRSYAALGVVANFHQRIFIPLSMAVPFYQVNQGYQPNVNWRVNIGFGVLFG